MVVYGADMCGRPRYNRRVYAFNRRLSTSMLHTFPGKGMDAREGVQAQTTIE